uniref:AlNc14C281G10120 protein n=1 Tax=Albugo laibachii Nc14 TaxID=890382 RepID=F0WUX3_9STRA|nr:AlNc14C281G10120 [Albugo laibachii Nc14]|eukprot:CCA25209.1 AlNc14C281G10120 [Albugo laibachii Nc14]
MIACSQFTYSDLRGKTTLLPDQRCSQFGSRIHEDVAPRLTVQCENLNLISASYVVITIDSTNWLAK